MDIRPRALGIVRAVFQPGLLEGLFLMGLLVLSSFLYYRSVNVQRFLEPALLIMRPRVEFAGRVRSILSNELKSADLQGVAATPESIYVDGTLLLAASRQESPSAGQNLLHRLGNVFLAIFDEPSLRGSIDRVFVITRYYPEGNPTRDEQWRRQSQYRAEFILKTLYASAPELEKNYSGLFSAASIATTVPEDVRWVEFKIIQNQNTHIGFLLGLEKYLP